MNLGSVSFKQILICLAIISLVFACVQRCVSSCSSDISYNKFEQAMNEGNLSKAREILKEDKSNHSAALQLIKAYLDVGDPNAAIDVYENITSNHANRYEMQFTNLHNGEYAQKCCKMLREYLMQHGEYERAWPYYPLGYDDEDYYGNAKYRYAWICDVICVMCKKGQQDDARNFVDEQLRWFVNNVDSESTHNNENIKANYGSEIVRQKLYNQIDNVY